jgi:hypothetical protein
VTVDVLTEITIDRPVDVVASYAADPANTPEWYVNIESVGWETPPPAVVGSKVAFVAASSGVGSRTPTSSSNSFRTNAL